MRLPTGGTLSERFSPLSSFFTIILSSEGLGYFIRSRNQSTPGGCIIWEWVFYLECYIIWEEVVYLGRGASFGRRVYQAMPPVSQADPPLPATPHLVEAWESCPSSLCLTLPVFVPPQKVSVLQGAFFGPGWGGVHNFYISLFFCDKNIFLCLAHLGALIKEHLISS